MFYFAIFYFDFLNKTFIILWIYFIPITNDLCFKIFTLNLPVRNYVTNYKSLLLLSYYKSKIFSLQLFIVLSFKLLCIGKGAIYAKVLVNNI